MKTKINRIVALLSIVILCFGFTACSSSGGGETTAATEAAVTEVSAQSVEITDGASSTAAGMASTTASGASTSAVVNNGTTARTNTTSTTRHNTTTTKRTTTAKRSTTKKTKTTTTKTTAVKQYCYLTIECSAILDNMDSLKDGHSKYVPSNGYIIKNYKFTITGKETVYDVLKEACKDNSIKLTAKNSTTGIYVQGINNLDEFDCGKYSGWIYRVNGIAPAKSSSMYTIHKGDRITWSYKC